MQNKFSDIDSVNTRISTVETRKVFTSNFSMIYTRKMQKKKKIADLARSIVPTHPICVTMTWRATELEYLKKKC